MPRRAGTAGRRGLSHLSPRGDARMVDVSAKPETAREAVASAIRGMSPKPLEIVRAGTAPKGEVLGVARTAGILAAKRTHELIPLCHPLRLTGIDVTFSDDDRGVLTIETRVRTVDKTGVEMEALMAASIAALAVYDMVKAVEKGVTIERVALLEKSGGKSGHWKRTQPPAPGTGQPRPKPASRRPVPVDVRMDQSGRVDQSGKTTEPRAPRTGHPRPKPATRTPLQ